MSQTIKEILTKRLELKKWLDTSWRGRFYKYLGSSSSKTPLLFSAILMGTICTEFFKLNHDFYNMELMQLQWLAATAPMAAVLGFMIVGFGVFAMMFAFHRHWDSINSIKGSQFKPSDLYDDTNEIKAKVVEQFMGLEGEQWDELAPLVREALNDDLPYMWWEDLFVHVKRNTTKAQPKVEAVTVQPLSVDQLNEQLMARTQNTSNNHLHL